MLGLEERRGGGQRGTRRDETKRYRTGKAHETLLAGSRQRSGRAEHGERRRERGGGSEGEAEAEEQVAIVKDRLGQTDELTYRLGMRRNAAGS